ncbi:hypothetical protein HNY73_011602, partial [Argiope bruennichi]
FCSLRRKRKENLNLLSSYEYKGLCPFKPEAEKPGVQIPEDGAPVPE